MAGIEAIKSTVEFQIDGTKRARLIDWMNEVCGELKLMDETFYLSVSLIDRYFQTTRNVPKHEIQAVGIAALFIAAKKEEVQFPSINLFLEIGDNYYKKSDIFKWEKIIIKQLDFRVHNPLPIEFIRRFVKAVGSLTRVERMMVNYLAELSRIDYGMVQHLPSEVNLLKSTKK